MQKTDRELLADALKLIEYGIRGGEAHDITEEIRARLADFKIEPRAWVASKSDDGKKDALYWNSRDAEEDGYALIEPLYSYPRQPVRLSDVEISALMNNVTGLATYKGYRLFADKIMDAMMEKAK